MAIQLGVVTRNARLDAIETTIGTDPVLVISNGATPGSCAAAFTGTVLASLTLPSDWMGAAANGAKALNGTWQDSSADNSGTAVYFRIYGSNGTAGTCHIQGLAGTAVSSDLVLDSQVFTAGQSFTITSFTLTDGNA